ncbi:Protein of unknown function [Weissella confusa LBAE C39-2]|jgi:hypothetical protein
MLSF